MPEAHALLSASGAHRWLECTPSARLEETFPSTTSSYAAEGTLAHELAAACALYWTDQITETEYEEQLTTIKENKWYTADMLEDCIAYAKLIRDKWLKLKETCPDATVMIEAQIKYEDWAPEGFGTADCLILADGFLEVLDFKYGKGKRVDAFGNPQMRMYTLGAYSTYGLVFNVEHITMTIYQPRLSGVMSTDEIMIDELLTWGEEYVKPRAKLAFEGIEMRIKAKRDRIEHLHNICNTTSQELKPVVVYTGPSKKLENCICEAVDLETEIRNPKHY